MALGIDTILQFKLFQQLAGQQVLNVQYYRVVGVNDSATLAGYAQAAFTQYTLNLKPFLSSALTYVRGELYEVNGLDFDIYAPAAPVPGEISGEVMPEFCAFSVQQIRASRATRHGWKRIAGMVEAQQSGGTVLTAAYNAMQAAAEVLWKGETIWSDPIVAGRTITVSPIIWGGNDPGFPTGRFSQILDVATKTRVTTQNTRKVGRGS